MINQQLVNNTFQRKLKGLFLIFICKNYELIDAYQPNIDIEKNSDKC